MTTSRDPSSSLTAFAKEVALLIPGAKTQNRGTSILSELVNSCRASSVTDVMVLHEHRCACAAFVLTSTVKIACITTCLLHAGHNCDFAVTHCSDASDIIKSIRIVFAVESDF